MNSKLIYRRYLWMVFIVLLAACGTAPTKLVSNIQPTSAPTFTSIAQTPTILLTQAPSPIPSLQPAIVLPTQTLLSTARPTPLPVARLELDAAKKKFDVLDQSPGCLLPCFNGLTPGISADWQAQDFFASLGFDKESITRDAQGRWIIPKGEGVDSQYFEIPYLISSNLSGRPNLSVAWQSRKVTSIAIGFLPYRNWISIPRFLSTIDETPQIILAQSVGGESAINRYFFLMFVFPKQQLEVTYRIPDLSRSFQKEPVCMSPDIPVDVYITLGNPSNINYLCEYCDPATGYDWSKQLNMKPEDLMDVIRDGDFCLSPGDFK